MSFTHLLTVLRARWLSAAIAFFLTISAVVVKTFTDAPQYTASASVLIDVQRPDPVAGVALQGLSSPGYMLTQVDVLRSLRVAGRVARTLNLLDQPELQQRWREETQARGSMQDWVAELLQKSLDARPSRGSNVINVAYTATDPAFAAAVANAFVQSYVETTLDLRVEPARQYNKTFEAHAVQLRADLEASKAKLSSYQRSRGIIETDEKLDMESTRLIELSSQLVALQSIASESGSRQGAAGAHADQMQEVMSNSVISALTADLSKQEARLDELNARLGDQHPQVQELQAHIARLRQRIETETKRVSGSVGVSNSVNQARLANLRASLEQQRNKVLEMKSRREGAAVLQQDVANAQRAYEAAQLRVSQTGLEGQTAQSNAAPLVLATEPTEPSSPIVRLNLILGGLLGFVVAVCTVAFREHKDRRLRVSDEILALAGHPLIAVIPRFRQASRPLAVSAKRLGFAHAKTARNRSA